MHIVEIEVAGPRDSREQFSVCTTRTNPASSGVVTGKLTYASFLSSLLSKHPFFFFGGGGGGGGGGVELVG